MQTHLVCYADEQMTISQELCARSAKEVGGIDHVHKFGPSTIDRAFYNRYKDTLEAPQRGGGKGFWLWKPYIVEAAIRAIPDGDVLIYCDSGVEWVRDVFYLIHQGAFTQSDVLLFGNEHRHIDWCKAEVISKMFGCSTNWEYNGQAYARFKQVQASVIIMRACDYTREFASAWLAWSCIPGFINDDFNPDLQQPEFREHRNDQSILTNLAIEDNIPLHWWPTQYGHSIKSNYPIDVYPQMFYHHRYRNNDWYAYMKHHDIPQTHSADRAINHFMKQPKNV